MCSSRVLSRLRLEQNRKNTRKSIHELLREAVFNIGRIAPQKLQATDLSHTSSLFIAGAKSVVKSIDRWLKHQNLDELGDLVKEIFHLQRTTPRYQSLLDLISDQNMDPSSRSSLSNMIKKVSRYWEISRQLYRIAKKFSLARNMKVQLAKLPQKAFERQANIENLLSPESVLSRHGFINRKQGNIHQLCRNLKVKKEEASSRYNEALAALPKAKIHAEIQIIAFCEMQAPKIFPRVVSSSKDACFLCNSFINLYGRMHTPKTHGRLYPDWRLPSLPNFKLFEQSLNKTLIENLRRGVSLGLAQGKLPVYPCPNESTVLTVCLSETTASMPGISLGTSSGIVSSMSTSSKFSETPLQDDKALSTHRLPNIQSVSFDSVHTMYPVEGEVVTGIMNCSSSCRHIVAESFEVYLSLEDAILFATKKEATLGYDVERLTAEKRKLLDTTYHFIDVECIKGELETVYSLSESNELFLAVGEVMLRIKTYP
ncbi:hypothetical protein N7533_005473 [Penicillium manginii]|uniref:uncharacterized protein n=1 Tax=Penicillium manginii TaxID=203109 RepID=UPI0025476869|nr:uncharacterized protein N7533_005473 [Penicillium manginii]KAJ5755930.1 hypothetical protein N7533_005473 [Penicillium manginii]